MSHRSHRSLGKRFVGALVSAGFVASLAGCPTDSSAPTIDFFDAAPAWGNAPLSTLFYWNITDADGDRLTCTVDLDADGVADRTIAPCHSNSSVDHVFTEPGSHPVTLTVSDGKHSVSRTIEVFANEIRFSGHVIFPEQLPGFVRADMEGDELRLLFRDSESAPQISLNQILWGTSGNGYLRKVTGTPSRNVGSYGVRWDLPTSPARLDEAIEFSRFGVRNEVLRFTDVVCLENCEGLVTHKVTPDIPGPKGGVSIGASFNFPDLVLASDTKVKSSLDVKITIERFVVDIDPVASLKEFTLELKPEVTGSVKLEVKLPGVDILDQSWPLGPRIAFAAVPIGPFVIVPNLEPKITAEVKLEPKITIAGKAGVTVNAGISYVKGEGTRVWGELTPVYTFNEPSVSVGLGSAKVGIAPGFSFLVFNVAGPFVDPEVFLKADLSLKTQTGQVCVDAKVGAGAKYGAEVDLFLTRIAAEDSKVLYTRSFWSDCFPKDVVLCGDGECDAATEDCITCAEDCGDCPGNCGNGTVDAGESCDPPSACPSACDDGDPCTEDRLTGDPQDCSARCEHPLVSACQGGDGCCPVGCTNASDGDCSVSCGDGVLDPGETCDPPSSCPSGCFDGDPCTKDLLSGSAATCSAFCTNPPITACQGGDGCCPAGCTGIADSDCASCGDGTCGPGETHASCPSDCPDVVTPTDPCDGFGGQYCGDTSQFPEGDLDTLYTCSGGVTVDTEVCLCGCTVAPPGVPDYCNACSLGEYGDLCTNGAECASGNCVDGGCCEGGGTILPGEPCGSSASCCSGYCGLGGICCWNTDPPGCMI